MVGSFITKLYLFYWKIDRLVGGFHSRQRWCIVICKYKLIDQFERWSCVTTSIVHLQWCRNTNWPANNEPKTVKPMNFSFIFQKCVELFLSARLGNKNTSFGWICASVHQCIWKFPTINHSFEGISPDCPCMSFSDIRLSVFQRRIRHKIAVMATDCLTSPPHALPTCSGCKNLILSCHLIRRSLRRQLVSCLACRL